MIQSEQESRPTSVAPFVTPDPVARPRIRPRPPGPDETRLTDHARAVLQALFGPVAERNFAVRLWDGSLEAPPGTPRFTLVLRHPEALRRMFRIPVELRLTEAYLQDDFDVEGDIEGTAALADPVRDRLARPGAVRHLLQTIRALPRAPREGELHTRLDGSGRHAPRHSPDRDAAAVRAHYDVGNDFYRLFLDPRMVYSCAYFAPGVETLADAQTAKLDHICRKLRLAPGMRLLDIGCGWGGLVMYAAERYGVQALGVTLSEEQAALARDRVAQAGLGDRVRIEIRDYRALPRDERFDRVVSVGMVEHVGLTQLPTYFATAYALTAPGGLFMNHGIVTSPVPPQSLVRRAAGRWLWGEGAFIDRYVFPDGELVTLATMIDTAERAGFETVDVESLRRHYARTLRHWVANLERNHDEAVTQVGEETYRVWRLYMAASAFGFASGRLNLAQVLLTRRTADGGTAAPMTRDDIYA